MKAWRQICVPHPDVLKGTFQQSEFAADISAVRDGKATPLYQNAVSFFERTYVTEGMRLLLTQVAQRLSGLGGEPVIQLQTAFGGGKTHTMLAVYHLATRTCSLRELSGIPSLLDQAGLLDVPSAKVAVLDGTRHAPGQPWQHGALRIHTLWGELAYQLGGQEAYALVKDSDISGTSPGKEVLRELLSVYSPCVVLIDELLAYIRQFPDGQTLSGGSYDSNLSFIQALTEALKLVPRAMMLASLPESETEAGSTRAVGAMRALQKTLSTSQEDEQKARTAGAMKSLQKTFGRVQALWKPVATEEAFEIVRRRLFEPISDTAARDEVCRAFAKLYEEEGSKLPSETHEARYFERLVQAYPIHPEVFDRLYEDWSTLESFQRTRGVLKLLAHVVSRLWNNENADWMIMPGSLPLDDRGTRDALVVYLTPGWDAVLEADIDGDRAETRELDKREARLGAVMASRRVARTLFLGTAPTSTPGHKGIRGIDRARILLGCAQPGQPSAAFSDALNRLCDRLHYLNSSGDKTALATRFWFDTRANLRREMEDRRGRLEHRGEIEEKIAGGLKQLAGKLASFDAVHFFTPHSDIPDDSNLRMVFLKPDKVYDKKDPSMARDAALEVLEHNGAKPRQKSNRLMFVAADMGIMPRLMDATRTALAWASIVEDIERGRLNIDRLQEEQAKQAASGAERVFMQVVRECYRWLLCPVKASPTERETSLEAHMIPAAAGHYAAEIEKICSENMLVIHTWSVKHLQTMLRDFYWKRGEVCVGAGVLWEDMQRYVYLPRLRQQHGLSLAILEGTKGRDFFGTAQGREGDKYLGFEFGQGSVQVSDTLLLIEPGEAARYAEANRPPSVRPADPVPQPKGKVPGSAAVGGGGGNAALPLPLPDVGVVAKANKLFRGTVEVNAATAKMKLIQIADEVISVLAADPNAVVRVTVEIEAEFPAGAQDQTKRAVTENAGALGFVNRYWE